MKIVLVQGTMIRYVHIPDEVDAIRNLQDHVRIVACHDTCSHALGRFLTCPVGAVRGLFR